MKIVPMARPSDPETSWEAAASVTPNVQTNRGYVLRALELIGPCTDEELLEEYPKYFPNNPQSPSGLRTRRKELCRLHLVEWTGRTVTGHTNRKMRIWKVS